VTKADVSSRTTQLLQWLEQCRAGNSRASEQLAKEIFDRMQQLAVQMFRGFPKLQSRTSAEDVCQGAMLRLLKALQEVRIESVRHFHNLAAVQLRRELLDLARQYQTAPPDGFDKLSDVPSKESIGRWIDLHEALAELDGDDRDLINDLIYMGLSQHEAAAALGVSAKTVQRRWHSLCMRLYDRLGSRLPEV